MKDHDIISIINQCFSDGLKHKASDIHIAADSGKLLIKLRINGVLSVYQEYPAALASQFFSRLKVLINADITKKMVPQEGRYVFQQKNAPSIDMRIIIMPSAQGETAVIRLLNRQDMLRPLTSLGMSDQIKSSYLKVLTEGQGLLIICGSTGSGKTTTLYASLLEIRTSRLNIVTVEDPVEYMIDGINQVQVNQESGLSVSNCLRYILRMDPDVIFVGEIRDSEAAELACTAALTGHLVVATMHTSDSISAITRLRDMGVADYVIAHALKGILAQTLIPRFCSCAGVGCGECGNTGVVGRTAVFEFLSVNDHLRGLILNPPYSSEDLSDAASRGFYVTLKEDADHKLKQGIISEKEYHLLKSAAKLHYVTKGG